MRQFLCSIQGTIQVETTHLARPLRMHDDSIMTTLLTLQIPPDRIYRINLCRIFLQVECLSEICNTLGTEVLQEVWNGQRPKESKSALLWPNQHRPHEKLWAEWRTVIKDAFLAPRIVRANKARAVLSLQTRLGPWIGHRHQTQRKWSHYVSACHKTIYVTRPTNYHCHQRIPTLFRRCRYEIEHYTSLSTLDNIRIVTPITCVNNPRSINIPHIPPQEFTPDDHDPTQARSTPTTLTERIQRLESWQSPLLQHLMFQQPESSMHQAISNNSATIIELASDGGARDDLGSFGWNIAIEQTTIWKNKGPTFGLLPGSFRAESYGMLSAFLFLKTYFQHYGTNASDQTILKFYCDSESLIKRIESKRDQSWTNPTSCLASDYDLESGIIKFIDELPITIRFIHVKSHQDKDTAVHLLPWEAQMNVTADHLATDYLENYADPSKIIPFIKPVQANLTIQGATITRRFANRLRLAASSPDLHNRMITRNNWSAQIFKSMHWDAPGKALMTLEHSTQIFLTKFVHEHLPTRKHMKKIGETDSDKCPSCLHTTETAWHMLNCENREEWRGKLHQTLHDTLHINKTQPDLQIILLQGVKEAIRDPNF
jgi:hypothetical protein